jgi:hypothetical protein
VCAGVLADSTGFGEKRRKDKSTHPPGGQGKIISMESPATKRRNHIQRNGWLTPQLDTLKAMTNERQGGDDPSRLYTNAEIDKKNKRERENYK